MRPTTPVRFLVSTVAALVAAGSELDAQSLLGMRAGVAPIVVDSTGPTLGETFPSPSLHRESLRPYAGLASLIVPGSGQFLLGKDRFIGYLAIEMLGWWQYSKDTRERAAQERAYKDYSRRIARAPFSSVFPDSSWEYYEAMRDFKQSGPFSLNATGPTRPDTNSANFNGKRWEILLSTQTPEAALAAYEREAIRPEYRWSWANRDLQYDLFVRTTDLRNDAARAAVKDRIVIAANHFLSMIDAFATFRLQVRSEIDGRTSVGATMHW